MLTQQFHDIIPGSSIAWVHDDAERTHASVAEALEDCPAHDLPIIASIRSCPWRGDFPPTAMQVSEWAQGRAFAIEAKRARMEQALKEHARRAQDQARPQPGSAEWTAQRAELEAVLNDFKRKFPSNRKDNGAT